MTLVSPEHPRHCTKILLEVYFKLQGMRIMGTVSKIAHNKGDSKRIKGPVLRTRKRANRPKQICLDNCWITSTMGLEHTRKVGKGADVKALSSYIVGHYTSASGCFVLQSFYMIDNLGTELSTDWIPCSAICFCSP